MIAFGDQASLYLRISVTDRCQLRCRYCMPPEGVPACRHEDILSFEEIVRFVECLRSEFTIEKIRLTGGDPLARRDIVKLVGMLHSLGVPELVMTTNAQQLAPVAADLRAAGLQRVNISLDSVDSRTFRRLTRGGELDRTVEGIDAAVAAGLRPVKLNAVSMRGVNDGEVCDLLSFALQRRCELRFLELMPVGHGAVVFDDVFIPCESVRRALEGRFHLASLPVERTSSSVRYSVRTGDGTTGVVGFISPCSEPFCEECMRLRLTADGRLVGCLARESGPAIRSLLADGQDPDRVISAAKEAMAGKRSDASFEQKAPMTTVGG